MRIFVSSKLSICFSALRKSIPEGATMQDGRKFEYLDRLEFEFEYLDRRNIRIVFGNELEH
jgi:hypothetical protein